MSRLGKHLAGGRAPSAIAADAKPTPLKRKLAAGRRGEDVTIPELGPVRIELIGDRAWLELEAAVVREMATLGIGELSVITASKYESETARRALAQACRDPDNHAEPFGTLEEWGKLDSTVVNIAWHAFGDVREMLDPIATELSEDEAFAIQAAVKKKDARSLRTFGAARLSLWLATTEGLLSTSPPPSSPSGESSADT